MRNRSLLLGGLLAALAFSGTMLLLAAALPGYSHSRQTVSEIGMRGSPVATPFAVGFLLTAALMLMFAVAMHAYWVAFTLVVISILLNLLPAFIKVGLEYSEHYGLMQRALWLAFLGWCSFTSIVLYRRSGEVPGITSDRSPSS